MVYCVAGRLTISDCISFITGIISVDEVEEAANLGYLDSAELSASIGGVDQIRLSPLMTWTNTILRFLVEKLIICETMNATAADIQ